MLVDTVDITNTVHPSTCMQHITCQRAEYDQGYLPFPDFQAQARGRTKGKEKPFPPNSFYGQQQTRRTDFIFPCQAKGLVSFVRLSFT